MAQPFLPIRALIIAGTCAAVCAAGVPLIAQAPAVLYLCVANNPNNAQLRMVGGTEACRPNESKIAVTAAAGATGPPGPAGAIGPTGAPGGLGAIGPTGPQGNAGVAGSIGPTGPQGVAGVAGPTGVQGLAGVAGAEGPTGPAGA